jgi:hypothetical protein
MPNPSCKRPLTNPAPEPSLLGSFIHGRLRWLHRLPQAALGMPRHPPSPGSKGRADRLARQQMDSKMTRTGLARAGLTPTPEDSQSDRYHRGQDPDTNHEASHGRPAVQLTSRQPTDGRFAVGQYP